MNYTRRKSKKHLYLDNFFVKLVKKSNGNYKSEIINENDHFLYCLCSLIKTVILLDISKKDTWRNFLINHNFQNLKEYIEIKNIIHD